MTRRQTVRTAALALAAHPMRSVLTILGIVIGIAAIIIITSLGDGVQRFIIDQLQGLGSKTIVVIPGRRPSGPSSFAQILSDSLKERDLLALEEKANVPTLARVMPLVFGAESASYQAQTYRPSIFGASEIAPSVFDLQVERGAFFSLEDVRERASVAIIGTKVRQELYGASDPVGTTLKIKNRNFRVIGLLPQKGQVSFFNFDETVLVPYTTAQEYIFGIKHFHRFILESSSEETIPTTVADATRTLRESHGIRAASKDDFFIQTQADLTERLNFITNAFTAFLAAVAALSLFVGGIGIMNIMLVSVTERTREIGLRKALGATDHNILIQFLLEAAMLTALGGIIGVLIGAGVSGVLVIGIRTFASVPFSFTVPLLPAAVGVGVAAAVGVGFGLYPARLAAQKDPIEALRYE